MNPTRSGPAQWAPLGRALLDFHNGTQDGCFVVHSNLWDDEPTPVEEYYRPDYLPLPDLELRALSLCRGRVLDVGAGAGRHALELQTRGVEVTALDVCPDAVTVMQGRGVRDARCGDLTAAAGERFDTILLLMHGIGLTGTLEGLAAFLDESKGVMSRDGQIICDSADLTVVLPRLLGEERSAFRARPYPGEVEFRLTYGAIEGQPYPWLFVDPRTLERAAVKAGFDFAVAARGARGAFAAVLKPRK